MLPRRDKKSKTLKTEKRKLIILVLIKNLQLELG